jgi:hypothetical protein
MQLILDRIAAWQAAGLIDPETAIRLRSDEADREEAPAADGESLPVARRGHSTIAQIFGPSVTIVEMFAYLGGAFILGAFDAFMARSSGFDADGGVGLAVGYGLIAIVLIVIGRFMSQQDPRERRAAGVLFAVAVGHVATAGFALTTAFNVDFQVAGVLVAAWATVFAVGLRLYLPALTTQFTLLASLTGLAAALLSLIEHLVVPETVFSDSGAVVPNGGPSALLILVATAAWWLVFAALLGILGLIEARSGDDQATGRRAAMTRLWAGITAVAGLAAAVSQSAHDPQTGEWGRVLEPWIGDLALIVLALILVERAFRRGASTFVYAAALALVIALTDFNFSYLSDSTEAGLLVEGLILLAAGFAVGKLRRRIGGDETPLETASLPTPA